MINRLKTFWEVTDGEDRRLLAHRLFDEIVYDLDKRQIVDFTMKSWAEPFLVLRAALYFDALSKKMKNRFNSGLMASSNGLFHDLNGALSLEPVLNPIFQTAKPLILFILYLDRETAQSSNAYRDQTINVRYAEGETISDLAWVFGISPQRVFSDYPICLVLEISRETRIDIGLQCATLP